MFGRGVNTSSKSGLLQIQLLISLAATPSLWLMQTGNGCASRITIPRFSQFAVHAKLWRTTSCQLCIILHLPVEDIGSVCYLFQANSSDRMRSRRCFRRVQQMLPHSFAAVSARGNRSDAFSGGLQLTRNLAPLPRRRSVQSPLGESAGWGNGKPRHIVLDKLTEDHKSN